SGVATTGTSTVSTSGTGSVTTSGVTTVGAGGASTTSSTVTGIGGFGGRGAGTRGGFPIDPRFSNPPPPLLPGIRPTPQCNQCVDVRCDGTSACSSNPACLMSTQCYFAACLRLPQQQQLPCTLKCFNGNIGLLMTAFEAVSCVYGACGPIC